MRGVLIASPTASPAGPAATAPAVTPTAVTPAAPPFDLDRAWRLHPQVALRPERFGALAYHFGTRRLSFLKDPTLLEVVETLAEHDSARAACDAAEVPGARLGAVARALGTLAGSRMIEPRP